MTPNRRTPYGLQLDAVNFALADVKGAFGPYVGIFLLTHESWNQAAIGALKTFNGLIGLAFNTPIGAYIDASRFKRGAIVVAVLVLAAGAVLVAVAPSVSVVVGATAAMAIAGDVFGPAVAAMTLGLLPAALFTRRIGRNSAFDHAGNVAIAVLAGAVGWWLGQRAVFFLVPCFAIIVAVAVLSIPPQAIDHEKARGGLSQHVDGTSAKEPASFRVLFECRPLLVFAACAALFHFANAPMLHLVGQKLALAHPGIETAVMSACVIAAQAVMIPMALLVGSQADSWGRKPLFLVGFFILPIRGVLYTLSDNSVWLVAVQLLDGVGNGLFGALAPLVLADLMRGTGRYNVARGMVATVQGIGASISNTFAGLIVVWSGYDAAFLALSGVAFMALTLLVIAMPETRASAEFSGADQGLDGTSPRPSLAPAVSVAMKSAT
jgi:predicted MFS family arabinose efflux permease